MVVTNLVRLGEKAENFCPGASGGTARQACSWFSVFFGDAGH
jgi:hypothetical protein